MYEIDPANVRSPREFENPKFDLGPRRSPTTTGGRAQLTFEEMSSVIKLKPPPKTTWEPDVKAMISTKKWLSTYGLRRNRLKLDQILGTIGFKHSDDYDRALKKPVCSRYGEGLFTRFPRRDGKIYNVNVKVSKEKIKQIENSLLQAINLYKRRIDWLTSESRRLFGVVEEHCICIVLDIKTKSPNHFDHCRNAIVKVLEDQVSQIAKFNLIRAAQDMVVFQKHAVPVTRDSLNEAMEWVRGLDSVAATTETSACEGVLKAFTDRNIEAVYLFSEGSSANTAMELTFQKLKGGPLPVNTVAFNSTDSTTVHFLKDLAQLTGGRFHAFAFNKLDSDVNGNSSYNHDTKAPLSGVPPGAGTREDVINMWQELEEARAILGEVQTILEHVPDTRQDVPDEEPLETGPQKERSEQYMSSKEWLFKRGLKARRLDVYDVLATCSFRHCDGVVDIKQAPHNDFTDAESRNKLVNAKYCDKFCHFQWKDGSIKHVHVTADVHRVYERKMAAALDDLQRRLDWLQQGSRELFGTIVEDQVYILIDISNSMENHLGLVKEKMYKLMQEQLRHKAKFNLVKFGSRASGWKDRAVEVNEGSLQSAWQWVRGLGVAGSTNTLSALKMALADSNTQAVYLLTDGRPDHPPKTILAQVQLQKSIPVHCISFNCNDSEANDFLAQLSSDTGGRYHYYSDDLEIQPDGPQPFESEDARLIREEMKKGRDDLKKLADLRGQCALLDWSNKSSKDMGCGKDHAIPKRPQSATGARSASQILSRDSGSPLPPKSSRPQSAKTFAPRRPMSALSFTSSSSHEYCHPKGRSRTTTYPPRPRSAGGRESKAKPPNIAYHNRTSWLRLRGSLDGWAVPETQVLLNKQQERYITALQDIAKQQENAKKKKLKKKKDPLQVSSKRWLKKNGLVAKKLTIYDALGGTMVKQKAKYVPILDKYVISQVFNEVMPLAHVTGHKQEINLINPGAVDLKAYEDKVKAALNLYRRRLDMIVWHALSDEDKEHLEPDSFLDNRQEYMEALERLGWPVTEKDIVLLEEEIEKGERYLKKSEMLRRHIREQKLGHSTSSHGSSSKFGDSRRPRSVRSSSRMEAYDDVDDKDSDDHDDDDDDGEDDEDEEKDLDEKDTDEDAEDAESALHQSDTSRSHGNKSERTASDKDSIASSSSPEEEDEYLSSEKDIQEEAGLMRRSSSLQASPRGHVQKSKKPVVKWKGVKEMNQFSQGARIVGRSKEDGLYYPGVVVRVPSVKHIDVFFPVVGDKVRIPSCSAIQLKGAQAQPRLTTGDCVLARLDSEEDEVWVPGIIMVGPADETRQTKFYTIVTYDADKISVLRNALLKISQQEYNSMVRFIMTVRGPKMTRDERASIVTVDKIRRLAEKASVASPKEKKRRRRQERDPEDIPADTNKDNDASSDEDNHDREEDEVEEGGKRKDEDRDSNRTKDTSDDGDSDEKDGGGNDSESDGDLSRSARSDQSSDHHSHSDDNRSDEEGSDEENAKDTPEAISSEIKERLIDLQRQLTVQHEEHQEAQKMLQGELREQKLQTEGFQQAAERHEALLEEHTSLKGKYDHIQGRYQRLRKRAEALLDRHRTLEGRHNQLESHHRELGDRLGNVQKEHGSKELENQTLETKYQELLEKMEQMEVEKRETREQLAGVQTQKDALEKELEELRRKEEALRDSANDSREFTNKTESEDGGNGEDTNAKGVDDDAGGKVTPSASNEDGGQEDAKEEEDAVATAAEEEEDGTRVRQGDDVIAQTSATGWFIRGTVESKADDGDFYVVDDNSTVMKVPQSLILTEPQVAGEILQNDDTVIGRHPDCPQSYAPATIQGPLPDLWYQVRFYNGALAQVPSEELYPIDSTLHDKVTEDILQKEDEWVGHPVVVRREDDGRYYLGVIKSRVERSPMFVVEWADESVAVQNSRHIFGSFTRRQKMALGDYILAMVGESTMSYLPGKVTGVSGNKLTVEFCDGSSFNTIDPVQCYRLPEAYYHEAAEFFLSRQDVSKATDATMYPSSSSSSSSDSHIAIHYSQRKSELIESGRIPRLQVDAPVSGLRHDANTSRKFHLDTRSFLVSRALTSNSDSDQRTSREEEEKKKKYTEGMKKMSRIEGRRRKRKREEEEGRRRMRGLRR
ncbi:von Willebrand factor A domain-containing protein 3B-like [Diadema antillarum]|uniref:von Willebrand factor A domain-containing protein 3B-like n=1 Tax=Diadema antillarum TaxID=105358 RepID=UPI003A8788D7